MGRIEVLNKNLQRSPTGAVRWLLRDTTTGKHYLASGVNAMFTGWEVLVFPCDEAGEVTDWSQIAGGRDITHEMAVQELEEALG